MNMQTFKYIREALFCEEVPITKIADRVGTPCFVYSRKKLETNLTSIADALSGTNHLICYALKANGNLNIIKILADRGVGADVVSGGELELALRAGIPPHKIVYAGVGKTDEEIERAIHEKILSLHIESFEEIRIIDKIAGSVGEKARVAIRINPDIPIESHPHIVTGIKNTKFGIELERAEEAFHLAASCPNLRVNGIHCHLGSMIMNKKPYMEAAVIFAELIQILKGSGLDIQFVDIGGGLGVDYFKIVDDKIQETHRHEQALDPESLFSSLIPVFKELDVKIIFEPGRYLVADSAALVTRVILSKAMKEKKFIIVDAGMNDLIRPTLYDSYHQIVSVHRDSRNTETVGVVGPICETGDYFAQDRLLPCVSRGDLLAVMAAGAYGHALSSNYNGRLRLPEVLVEGDEFRLIRKRQVLDDLWRDVVWGGAKCPKACPERSEGS